MQNKRLSGFWFLVIIGIFLLAMLIIGQTMSFINYEFTVSTGLQEPVNIVGEMGVAMNKGFGAGDTIIYIPLLIIGLTGTWLKKPWGIFTMSAAMAITAYWPLVSLFILIFAEGTPGFNFTNYTPYTIILLSVEAYGLWGMWFIYKNRKLLSQ